MCSLLASGMAKSRGGDGAPEGGGETVLNSYDLNFFIINFLSRMA